MWYFEENCPMCCPEAGLESVPLLLVEADCSWEETVVVVG